MKELKEANFHSREITSLIKEEAIVKIKPGYYRYSDYGFFKDVKLRIYNREKKICDMFRYRNKLGEDLAMQALKYYLNQKKKTIAVLIKFAEICQVKTIIMPILKGLLA